ncbi:hypothetical protein [Nocardia miyunensis]|uniref:hypothetical protein n=1 Tax=Nocardia miyunensis TaxID=282684 RepID=UPI000A5EC703|nr:hypothetical protein [Nocardia miyunensis]
MHNVLWLCALKHGNGLDNYIYARKPQAVDLRLCRSVDLGGAYYNPKPQVEALEALRRKLPDPTAPALPPADRFKPGRARQLGTDQVQELIAGYESGETVYQLGAGSVSSGGRSARSFVGIRFRCVAVV